MHPAIAFLAQLDPSKDAIFYIETRTDVPTGAPKPKRYYAGLNLRELVPHSAGSAG